MSHYILVPVNENGVIFDSDMNAVIAEAMTPDPFDYRDIYVYSHGWSNDAARAMDEYNRFSVDFANFIGRVFDYSSTFFIDPPADTLGVGIHWPSEITEDPNSALNKAQLLTFYTMEQRAESVGKNAVYAMVRLMLHARMGRGAPPRFHFVGHSFGCKVLLAALQDVQTDIANKTIGVPPGTTFNVALLEPATDDDNLDPGDIYGSVADIAGLRMLITRSRCDTALVKWFHDAGSLANIIHRPLVAVGDFLDPNGPPQALGAVGPTQATISAFGADQYAQLSVTPGYSCSQMFGVGRRLICADLTPVHQYRIHRRLYQGGFAGSHSDINISEVYNLIAGFFFGVSSADPLPVTIVPAVPLGAGAHGE